MAFSQRHGDGEAEKLSETGSDISQIGGSDSRRKLKKYVYLKIDPNIQLTSKFAFFGSCAM